MDSKYAGLIMTAPTEAGSSWHPRVLKITLGAILWGAALILIGYLIVCFALPWVSEVVCTLFYKTISWGALYGFH